jgi:hypothetical protein
MTASNPSPLGASPEPRITRLPRNGPKAGQSTAAWLAGKRRGDAQWDKVRESNLARLLPNRRRKPSP